MFFFKKTTGWGIAGTSFNVTVWVDCIAVDPQTCTFSESGSPELSIGVLQSGEPVDPSLAQLCFITHVLIIHKQALQMQVKVLVLSMVYGSTLEY